jgi:hypothetical protein
MNSTTSRSAMALGLGQAASHATVSIALQNNLPVGTA